MRGKQKLSRDKWAEAEFPYAGPVYGDEEIDEMVKAIKSGRFWGGEYVERFQHDVEEYLGVKKAVFVNSGSSALLASVSALHIPKGSRVIIQGLCFPTTVNALLVNGLVPVFTDMDLETLSVVPEAVLQAVDENDAKAYVHTHTVGCCGDVETVRKLLAERKQPILWIEDFCDNMGAKFKGKPVGTYATIGCTSLHPAHQMTAGLGGLAVTDDVHYGERIESTRDWGRIDQSRAEQRFIHGRDMRYFYVERGFNLQATEVMAAMGCVQLKKLDGFNQIRRRNFDILKHFFTRYPDHFVIPKEHPEAENSWFGYPIIIRRSTSMLTKIGLMTKFEENGIQCRSIYGGLVFDNPGYAYMDYMQKGDLSNCKYLHENAFWIGCYHGLSEDQIKQMCERIEGILPS